MVFPSEAIEVLRKRYAFTKRLLMQHPIQYYLNGKQLENTIGYTSCTILGLQPDNVLHVDIAAFDVPDYIKVHYGGGGYEIPEEVLDDIRASKNYLVERWKYLGFDN